MDVGDQPHALWRRSSLCTGGECVEVTFDCRRVRVRNSTNAPSGPVLDFTQREWDAFVLRARAHEFDWPSPDTERSAQHVAVEHPSSSELTEDDYIE